MFGRSKPATSTCGLLEAEQRDDVVAHFRRRRRRERRDRRPRRGFARCARHARRGLAQPSIVGPEVVAPLARRSAPRRRRIARRRARRAAAGTGPTRSARARRTAAAALPARAAVQHVAPAVGRQHRVQRAPTGSRGDSARRPDPSSSEISGETTSVVPRQHHRRQLIAERLARSGRHHREHVAAAEHGGDDLLLSLAGTRDARSACAACAATSVAVARGRMHRRRRWHRRLDGFKMGNSAYLWNVRSWPPMKTLAAVLAVVVSLFVPGAAAAQAPALERHEFVLHDFRTESGVVLPEARVVYSTLGTLNAAGDNAILLPSHYMANFNGYNWLIGATGSRARSGARFPGADGAVRQRAIVVAEQHAGAVSRPALPGHDDPRQRRRGPSSVHDGAAREASARGGRLLDGRGAGVPVGGQLSGLHGCIVATSGTAKCYGHGYRPARRADRRADRRIRRGRAATTRRRRRRASRRSAWCGPDGCTRRSGGGRSCGARTRPPGRRSNRRGRGSASASAPTPTTTSCRRARGSVTTSATTPGFNGDVETRAAIDQGARAVHAVRDRPVLSRYRRALRAGVHSAA